MGAIAIRTTKLTRDFGSIRAVDNLNLEVPAGCVFGFLGPNGAGKTTTIRLLLGLVEATSGGAEVLGYDSRTRSDDIRSRCGALMEHSGLYERLTAEDNLRFYAKAACMPEVQIAARIHEVLNHFELWERRKETVESWSRGMKQKLAIGRALLHKPELVFLDEPTSGLDPVAAAAIRDDLARLASGQGTTIFLTTHNLVEAERLCSRVAVVRRGRVLAYGAPNDLRHQYNVQKLEIFGRGFCRDMLEGIALRFPIDKYLIENERLSLFLKENSNIDAIIDQLKTAGAEIIETRHPALSLEDVFFSLMKGKEEWQETS
jgi:ABC-2 type transport system ATP-binding protein